MSPLPPPPLSLRRALLWRIGGAAALALLALAWSDWREWRQRLADDLPATAALATKLLNEDLARRSSTFDRATLAVDLGALATLALRVPLCVTVSDINARTLAAGCLPRTEASARAGTFAQRLAGGITAVERDLALPPGLKVGDVVVTPHWPHEGAALIRRAGLLAIAGAGLALALLLGARLVGRALAPANQVLAALTRLASGDLQVRLPTLALQELRHIGEGFNRVAVSWSQAHREQQQLAERLLQAREAERRRLARELHDEMGQSLAALQAEAAALVQLAGGALPQAVAGAQAMTQTTGQLLEGLQRILADLRPQALDRFGLPAALRALVDAPRRRADGSRLTATLQLAQPLPSLPPDHDVHVYRIVQEALTNALRHGDARRADVTLACEAGALRLSVVDDGRLPAALAPKGQGLLGLHERVAALGGRLSWDRPAEGGVALRVWLPLPQGAA